MARLSHPTTRVPGNPPGTPRPDPEGTAMTDRTRPTIKLRPAVDPDIAAARDAARDRIRDAITGHRTATRLDVDVVYGRDNVVVDTRSHRVIVRLDTDVPGRVHVTAAPITPHGMRSGSPATAVLDSVPAAAIAALVYALMGA